METLIGLLIIAIPILIAVWWVRRRKKKQNLLPPVVRMGYDIDGVEEYRDAKGLGLEKNYADDEENPNRERRREDLVEDIREIVDENQKPVTRMRDSKGRFVKIRRDQL